MNVELTYLQITCHQRNPDNLDEIIPIINGKVTISRFTQGNQSSLNQDTTIDSINGTYEINLLPGIFEIKIEKKGYKPQAISRELRPGVQKQNFDELEMEEATRLACE